MYILSDLNGNLIQRSNSKVDDLQSLTNKFSNDFNITVIGTTDESLYAKTEEYECFSIVVVNGAITDILREEKAIEEVTITPTIEERLKLTEDAINFILGL